ncbi:FecCD family ABC transporter permease [Aestuariivirga sp.]|uniref:FecCD family ABC transporter permease n=1 Tax=Aestuariivirga sp. TaxID=2650926 RepID=UPI0039E4A1C2
MTLAVALGAATIPLATVWGVILNKLSIVLIAPTWSAGQESIIWDVRLPRVLLAAFVGAGLALVGAVLQPLTRNPLADPHLLGVSSGASFGAILALLHTGLIFGATTVPLFAFAGALGATALVLMVARLTSSATVDRLVLSGVAVSFVIASLANLLIFLGDPRAQHTVVFWMLGGLGLAQWGHLAYPGLALFGGLVVLMFQAASLNGLALGDETATSLGLRVQRLRLELFTLTALLTGVMVAFSGAIGFVGLMVPHITRLLVGSDNHRVLPVAASLGATGLVIADLVARIIIRPEDMPIGVITGLVGGVMFIVVLRRKH